MMNKWCPIQSKKEFETIRERLTEIKKYHPQTNALEKLMEYSFAQMADAKIEFVWFSEDGRNANFLKKTNDVWYLLYYISQKESYDVPNFECSIICEVFDKDIKNKQKESLELLYANHIVPYASFHKYILNLEPHSGDFLTLPEKNTNYLLEGGMEKTEPYLFAYFEQEKDSLPDRKHYDKFESSRAVYWIVEGSDTVGACIGKKKGFVFDEEYIFIKSEYRKQGYAKNLLEQVIKKNKESGLKRQIGWIDDINMASLKLHIQAGYVRQSEKKIVLRRKVK